MSGITPSWEEGGRGCNEGRGLVDDNGRGLSRCSRRDDRVSTCTALPVLPADEYQAKQLVSSSALTKFPLGGEVFGKELRARDKKKVAPLMYSRVLLSLSPLPELIAD